MNKYMSGSELIAYVRKQLDDADIRLYDSSFMRYISEMTPADFAKASESFKWLKSKGGE